MAAACSSKTPTLHFKELNTHTQEYGTRYIEALLYSNKYIKKGTTFKISCTVEPTGTKFYWDFTINPDSNPILTSHTAVFTNTIPFPSGKVFEKDQGTVTCVLPTPDDNSFVVENGQLRTST